MKEREKRPFMIAGKINTSLSCYNSSVRYNAFQCKEYFFVTFYLNFSNINSLITFRNLPKMHLFLRYNLSKRYCEKFFVTLFYNWQSKLFIHFVPKKDLKKCSIRCVVQALMFLTLDFIKIIFFLDESIARFFPW